MKTGLSTQLGQQLHLTPQLLQSIRLLQLNSVELEQEIRQALETNPLLEMEPLGEVEPESAQVDSAMTEVAAFDELPEPSLWDVPGASWSGDEDPMQRLPAAESSDPHLRVLRELALDLDPSGLAVAAYWLEHTDAAGYLDAPVAALRAEAAAQFRISTDHVESVRQRLLHGTPAGLAASDLGESLLAQLVALPGPIAARHLAGRILKDHLPLLAGHDHRALALRLNAELEDIDEAVRLILSLQPRAGQMAADEQPTYVIPDVVAWHADRQWLVALNPATSRRIGINPAYERALAQSGELSPGMRDMLQQARWLSRGLAMRNETLLRASRVIVERQAAFLGQGDEAMAPLTLKEVADAIGMHESTISRITTGKYLQTPRGTFELKYFFAVRLEGANVAGAAVKAMVRRLIDSEPAAHPLSDEAIAGLLARQGITIARRTVAKYREQLDIAPARMRRRRPSLSLAG